jgi:hypothetical protein
MSPPVRKSQKDLLAQDSRFLVKKKPPQNYQPYGHCYVSYGSQPEDSRMSEISFSQAIDGYFFMLIVGG